MRSWMRVVALLGMMTLAVAGCSGDDGEDTTTTAQPQVTTLPPASDTTEAGTSSTATTGAGTTSDDGASSTTSTTAGMPGYKIEYRGVGDERTTVVILLDPSSYTSLSDIDVQEVIRDVYELFPPVLTAHVVDSEEAAAYVLLTSRTLEEQAVLDEHYLARLEDGIRILFEGPFEEYGMAILGS